MCGNLIGDIDASNGAANAYGDRVRFDKRDQVGPCAFEHRGQLQLLLHTSGVGHPCGGLLRLRGFDPVVYQDLFVLSRDDLTGRALFDLELQNTLGDAVTDLLICAELRRRSLDVCLGQCRQKLPLFAELGDLFGCVFVLSTGDRGGAESCVDSGVAVLV